MEPSPSSSCLESPAALYQEYAPLLFAYLRRQTASLEDAEDLLVEVFLAALERGQLLSVPKGERRRWLFGVAQHKLVDAYRRSARHPVVPLGVLAERGGEAAAPAPAQAVVGRAGQSEPHTTASAWPAEHEQ